MLLLTLMALAAWMYLLFGRGQFWRADQVLPAAPPPMDWPDVAVIIPARDEAETIGRAVAAHDAAGYKGTSALIVADDHSSDGTAAKARAAAGGSPIEIAHVPDLPLGWSGKLWALENGIEAARKVSDARYYLFTDADIEVSPSLLGKLVAHAEHCDLALVSVMARLDDRGFWGGLLVPAFIFFFQKLYPFPLVNDPESPVAGAAGGVTLVRRDALEAIGGIASLRAALIDDCTLAARIKKRGLPIGLYLSSSFGEATSLRANDSYDAMEAMVARSAYTQLGYSKAALAGTLLSMLIIYLAGPLAFLSLPIHGDGEAALVGLMVWGLMAYAYRPTLKRYGRPGREAFLLPLAAAFYGWFTWLSALRHWQGHGGRWKGRTYAAEGSPRT